ncbi:MFS transporter [Isosphaeraceae bacterium EP7]
MITLALLLAMAVTALEQTVVSTAMPSIISSLNGLEIYPWVFSAYLLAATVSTPLYGKLADLLGRKRVLLFGLFLFSLGSILSGLSRSMPELIVMRIVQGLGAGAVAPVVLTMLGDLFSMQERARVQGLFSAVWGVSSLAGPTLGGYLTDSMSWRAVFFVSVPFAAVAIWILMAYVRETLGHREVLPIDWPGAALLAGGSTLLLLGLLHGGSGGWTRTAGLIGLSLAFLVAFIRRELVAEDPILPMDLMTTPTILAANVGSFVIGGLLFGLDTYIPLYVQGVRGGTASDAGLMVTPLFLSWSISVAVAARVAVRFGFRATALVGSVLITLGMFAIAAGAQWPAWSKASFLGGMFIIGLGMGPTSLSYILGVQNVVPWGRRGVATGGVLFFRTVGGALSVAVLGASLGAGLTSRLAAGKAVGIDVSKALRPETHSLLPPDQLLAVQDALGQSLTMVFLEMCGLALLALVCSSRLIRGIGADPVTTDGHQPGAESAMVLME